MNTRRVIEQLKARPSSDGDGVKLLRVFGGAGPERFDPFLLMDEFGSNDANDYIGGFPPHPHRGFETITYMLQGKMEHRDHMENIGLLNDGDVQWMTAGRGVIHSEMPKQTEGRMRGFQIWLNLPADKKMQPARYQDVPAATIPYYALGEVSIKAIAGKAQVNGKPVQGFFQVENTDPLYLDIHLAAGATLTVPVTEAYTSLVYVYDGEVSLSDKNVPARAQTLSRLSSSGDVFMKNTGDDTARIILLAGQPLKEPVTQYGPFVMNTAEQIEQAIQDYRAGTLTI